MVRHYSGTNGGVCVCFFIASISLVIRGAFDGRGRSPRSPTSSNNLDPGKNLIVQFSPIPEARVKTNNVPMLRELFDGEFSITL